MYTQTQEAQCRGVEDCRGEAQGCLNDQRCHAVWQHGDEHQAWQGGASQTGSGHVVAVQFAHDRGASQAHVGRQRDDGDGDHGVDQARAKNRDDGNGQQQRRQGQHDVHQTHDGGPKDFREETGQQTHEDPRSQRHHHRRQTDQQRQTRALDQTRQQIAAQLVGAQQKLPLAAFEPDRRGQQEVAELLAWVMGCNPWGEEGAENHQQHERQACDSAFVLGKMLPELFVNGRVEQALIDCYHGSRCAHKK